MRKTILICLVMFSTVVSKAQEDRIYKPFKCDISFGDAIPPGSGTKGGFIFAVEPKYGITDDMVVGLRIEAAVMARGFTYPDGTTATTSVSANASYAATFDYYFSDNDFRPFAGAGVGFFTFASATTDGNNDPTTADQKVGGLVRAGFEYHHLRVGLEYNIVPSTSQSLYDANTGNTVNSMSKNGYLGIKVGVLIGGGRF